MPARAEVFGNCIFKGRELCVLLESFHSEEMLIRLDFFTDWETWVCFTIVTKISMERVVKSKGSREQ